MPCRHTEAGELEWRNRKRQAQMITNESLKAKGVTLAPRKCTGFKSVTAMWMTVDRRDRGTQVSGYWSEWCVQGRNWDLDQGVYI